MNILAAIVAGLTATAVMTILIKMGPLMGLPRMPFTLMLGLMFTADEAKARVAGPIVHFINGSILAVIYVSLWSAGIGAANWRWGLLFGFVHAIVAMVAMPIMLKMHPRPPAMPLGAGAMFGMLMGHLVFGAIVAVVYAALR